ncbi:MAG: heat-inducible transcriptional repressor HrcA [Candidatus Eisenbacteria bacterium]
MRPRLEKRERVILGSVVRTYVTTAQPVGSKRVAEETGLGFSSATIRSLMSRMEERGLMRRPHASAGRVPTDRGYRVYVDDVMEPAALTREEQEEVFHGVERAAPAPDRLPRSLAGLLSALSGQMGFASPPRLDEAVFRNLYADRSGGERIAFFLTLDSGLVRSALAETFEPIAGAEVARGLADLNHRFAGLSIGRIRRMVFGADWALHLPPTPFGRLFRRAAEELLEVARETGSSVAGFDALLAQPEFRNPEELDSVAGLFKEGRAIAGLLEPRLGEAGASVWIGMENETEELRLFSVVASRYRMGRFSGVMGMVGPTRMPYERALAIIGFLRHVLDCRIGPAGES